MKAVQSEETGCLGAGEGLVSNAWAQLVHICHGRHHVLQDADHHLQVQLQGQVVHHLHNSAPKKVLRNLHVGFIVHVGFDLCRILGMTQSDDLECIL